MPVIYNDHVVICMIQHGHDHVVICVLLSAGLFFANAFENLMKAWGELIMKGYIMTRHYMKTAYSS